MCEQLLSGAIDLRVLEMLRSLQNLSDSGGTQTEEAVVLSRQVIELAPECALGHFHLGKAMFEREPKGAEKALRSQK